MKIKAKMSYNLATMTPKNKIIRFLERIEKCRILIEPTSLHYSNNQLSGGAFSWFAKVLHPKYGEIEIDCYETMTEIAKGSLDKIKISEPSYENEYYSIYVERNVIETSSRIKCEIKCFFKSKVEK
jgi:hypothetical protein